MGIQLSNGSNNQAGGTKELSAGMDGGITGWQVTKSFNTGLY